jgi:hypothetical protein
MTNEAITEAAETSRTKIANREWINDAGETVAEEAATGVSYEFLGRTKDGISIPGDGEKFTRYFRDMSQAELYMCAGFGLITLMGNVTNTWMGDKDVDKPAKACEAITERVKLINSGTWIDRAASGGSRVDEPALARAIVTASGGTKDFAAVLQKLTDDAEWKKKIRSVPQVAAEYAKEVGRASPSLDTLLAGV